MLVLLAWCDESESVEEVWAGVVGGVVHHFVGRNAEDLACGYVKTSVGEGEWLEDFAPG